MKKVFLKVTAVLFVGILFASTLGVDGLKNKNDERQATEYPENCPPGDRDCDGYSDWNDAYPTDPTRH